MAQSDPTKHDAAEVSRNKSEFEHEEALKQPALHGRVDKELSQYVSDVAVEISSDRNKELVRKLDKRVLPVLVIACLLQALTQSTLPFASIMGLIEDTGMRTASGAVSQQYSWLTTGMYLVMLVAEYPQNYIITKVPLAKYLGFCMLCEGVIIACHAACVNFTGLIIGRCLLGIFEAACQPCLVLISVMWYRKEEQVVRIPIWYMMSGVQQIIGGLLAYGFTYISKGPLAAWEWWFIFIGVLLVAWGLFVMYWLPDSPTRAKCFTVEEKRDMIERVRDNQTGVQNREFKREQVVEALLDPQVWAYSIINLYTTLPTAGLAAFANIIIKSFGYSARDSQLLSMPLGLYVMIILLSSSWFAKKTGQNVLVMLVYMILSFVGTVLLMTISTDTLSQRIGLLLCYYITFSFWATTALSLSLLSRNIAGQTKKMVTLTVTFIMWAVGNCIGPQVFLEWNAPRYFIAFATHLGCYSLLVIVLVSLRWYLQKQNQARDRLAAEGVQEADPRDRSRAFDDLTDKENLSFRYVF
ncbi:major facilitator superfamily domain-containing protein [Aspergillus keveii]|uniref:Major facilitator superfamily domain-containing protein n=1 Tax=Aspergillus keveii TaxID=714993 RepID=A0ABR4FZG7_9EURO